MLEKSNSAMKGLFKVILARAQRGKRKAVEAASICSGNMGTHVPMGGLVETWMVRAFP